MPTTISGTIIYDEANSTLQGSTSPTATNDVVLVRLGNVSSAFGGSSAGAESVAFENGKVYSTNLNANTIVISQITDNPGAPASIATVGAISLSGLTEYKTGGVNSVAVKNGIIAVAYENSTATSGGYIALFNAADNTLIKTIQVGVLPDMVTFSPDGSKILVANEGERLSVSSNPAGSISIIDMSGGAASASVTNTISFSHLDGSEAALRGQGLNMLAGQAAGNDIEPEYITISPDGTRAYVTLQEVNGVAVIDLTDAGATKPIAIQPLGYVDWSLSGNTLDTSDRDGAPLTPGGTGTASLNLRNFDGLRGLLQPDAIASFSVGGSTYFITANEGDARVPDSLTDVVRLNTAGYVLDPTAFPNAATLKLDANLGRLNVLTGIGDTDNDGDYDKIYTGGGRGITIFKQNADGSITKVRETGGEFEAITSALGNNGSPAFNSNQSVAGSSFDTRSDDKGPEPEGVTIGVVNGRTYAFVGLERVGGIMVYDVTDPANATFVGYQKQASTDLGPETQTFISAANSPTGQALLVSGNEISNTVTLYSVQTQSDGNDTINGGADADTFSGRAGNDTISGFGGNDTLNGDAGNDTLTGGAGNDTLNGGADTDTASFSGARSNYTITRSAGVVTVVDNRGGSPDGTDSLTNVENLAFSDGTVTVYSVFNQAPVINGGDSATVTLAENNTAVTTIVAVEPDLETVTYAIDGGADASKFDINASTGELTFKTAPNFEAPTDSDGDNTYSLFVTASDGSLTDLQLVTVNITNVNETPVITSNLGGDTAAVNFTENGTGAVTTVQATDQEGTTLVYALFGGADQDKFDINTSTGALTFKSAPNFEAPTDVGADNGYEVIVATSDGSNVDIQTLTVSVTNQNEAPVITSNGGSPTGSVTVLENVSAVTTVLATDPDASTTLTYALSGTDAALFNINSGTGAITFKNAANFERPVDNGKNNQYDVVVTVSDGAKSDTQALAITVSNVADTTSSQSSYLLPTQSNVTFQAIITTGDATSKIGGGTYLYGGIPDGLGMFDNGDGTVTVLTNHEIGNTLGVVRDHGAKGSYVSKLIIDKADLSVISGGDAFSSVKLWNPVTAAFETSTYAFSRFCSADLAPTNAFYNAATGLGTTDRIYLTGEESGVEGKVIGVVATGSESGTAYELAGLGKFAHENAVANGTFTQDKTIVMGTDDGTNGQVYVYIGTKQDSGNAVEKAGLTNGTLYGIKVNNLDTLALGNNESNTAIPGGTFSLVALGDVKNTTGAALDAASEAAGVTSFLRPEDISWDPTNPARGYFVTTNGFNAPSRLYQFTFNDITDPTQGGTIVAVLDGTEGQQMLDNITVNAEGKVILQEDVGNQAHLGKVWQYDPVSDKLTQIAQHDPSRFLSGGANFLTQDEESSGVIDVTATFGDANTKAYLLDVQSHKGVGGELVEGGQLILMKVALNAPVITSNLGGATSTVNVGENSTAVTTVTATDDAIDTVTYSLNGGADVSKFNIDANTGALTFKTAPNFEAPTDGGSDNSYIVVVRASDGTKTDDQTITVNVTNVNEAPVITSGNGATASVTIAENGTAVTTVVASDVDAGTTLLYKIYGGADAGKFAIDGATGALTFKVAPDFDIPGDADGDNVYDVRVGVEDGNGLFDEQDIAVTVTNVIDGTPVISSNGGGAAAAINVDENQTAVTTVITTGGDLGTVTYSLGGTDASLFSIDAAGVLTFNEAPDHEAPDNVYNVTVTSLSQSGNSDTQALTITVDDVNEAPVITSNGGGTTAAVVVDETDTIVTQVIATDVDAGATQSYSISGDDAALFAIDKDTGELTFKAEPNVETPQDADGDNVYEVTVRASDGTLSDTQALSIEVRRILTGTAAADKLTGTTGPDHIFGLAGKDQLTGLAGNDYLDGGTEADRLTGGTGNDTYIVDNAGDRVFENVGEGTDTVLASAARFNMGAAVENLTFTVGGAHSGQGNALDNVLTGNLGQDNLRGLGGQDKLYGLGGNDSLSGGDGNDLLDGGIGADVMTGGAGDDLFIVDDAADKASERKDGGTDRVESSVTHVLRAYVENLTLTGTEAINGTGNRDANVIVGNAAANTLNGGVGNDTLHGGLGNDSLIGGAGADKFVFDTAPNGLTNVDLVRDFTKLDLDVIVLDKSVFTELGAVGTLAQGAFFASATATSAADASDRIIYNTATGDLYYDEDGVGGTAAVQIATIGTTTHPALAYTDFQLVA